MAAGARRAWRIASTCSFLHHPQGALALAATLLVRIVLQTRGGVTIGVGEDGPRDAHGGARDSALVRSALGVATPMDPHVLFMSAERLALSSPVGTPSRLQPLWSGGTFGSQRWRYRRDARAAAGVRAPVARRRWGGERRDASAGRAGCTWRRLPAAGGVRARTAALVFS